MQNFNSTADVNKIAVLKELLFVNQYWVFVCFVLWFVWVFLHITYLLTKKSSYAILYHQFPEFALALHPAGTKGLE